MQEKWNYYSMDKVRKNTMIDKNNATKNPSEQ